ncbi:MAG: ABC transporter substrate-binding protein, partial [Clostridiales bacterium]|nr:ABC transporter substrate-binding protein [Clostridiales bacterium]
DMIDESKEIDNTRTTTADSDERYDEIVIAGASDMLDCSPWNVKQDSKPYIYPYIYEALFDYDESTYYPVLAKDYTIGYAEDGTEYWDVEIYDYIYDYQGNHITADDVVFSYETQLAAGYVVKSGMFDHIEKVDEYTVRLCWNKVIDGVCELEWPLCNIVIFSQAAYESGNFATEPVGTGPYYVESFVAGSECVLKANDNYWQTDESLIELGHHSNVETIRVQCIKESAQQVIALENYSIDFATSIPADNIADFMEGGEYGDDYDVYKKPESTVYYMMGNMNSSIWSDVNFRFAVFYALDNDAISTVSNLPACTAPTSAAFSEYYELWDGYDCYINEVDLEKAADYLSQSSYNGETVKLICSNTEALKNIATMIQGLLGQISIDVSIETMESTAVSTLTDDPYNTEYDMFIATAGGPNVIGAWNRTFNTADFGGVSTIGGLVDQNLTDYYALCNTAEGYTHENMTEFLDYILENAYYYAICYNVTDLVHTSDIAEIATNRVGDLRLGDCTYYLD